MAVIARIKDEPFAVGRPNRRVFLIAAVRQSGRGSAAVRRLDPELRMTIPIRREGHKSAVGGPRGLDVAAAFDGEPQHRALIERCHPDVVESALIPRAYRESLAVR